MPGAHGQIQSLGLGLDTDFLGTLMFCNGIITAPSKDEILQVMSKRSSVWSVTQLWGWE